MVGLRAVAAVAIAFAASCGSSSNEASGVADSGNTNDSATDTASDAKPTCPGAVLESDPRNCGVCRHDCMQGECLDGVCRAFVFDETVAKPYALVASDAALFVASATSAILRVETATRAKTTLATGQKFSAFLAWNGSFLAWTNGGDKEPGSGATLAFVPSTGSVETWVDGARKSLATAISSPAAIVLDGTAAYWGELDGLFAASLDGTGKRRVTSASPYGLTQDATNLYFTDYGAGAIRMVPKAGGTTRLLASKQVAPSQIVVDATHAYWTSFSTTPNAGGLYRVALDGTGLEQLAPATRAYGIAIDGESVYFGDLTGGVTRVHKSSGSVELISTDTASFVATADQTARRDRLVADLQALVSEARKVASFIARSRFQNEAPKRANRGSKVTMTRGAPVRDADS